MARVYSVTPTVRFANRIISFFIRLGLLPAKIHMLTVRGRKSGTPYTNPVSVVSLNGKRYLVAPYGEVNWVKNARANGEVMLSRGGKQETLQVKELSPGEAAPIIKEYVTTEAIVRPYFNATPQSSMKDFEADAAAHPVFELTTLS